MKDSHKNPSGFSERLRLLCEGRGYSTRDLAAQSGVSHGTIANWLSGTSRANLDDVAKVAAVFGWTAAELYDGTPKHNVMDRVAQLESFRARAVRLAGEIVEVNPESSTVDATAKTASRAPMVVDPAIVEPAKSTATLRRKRGTR